MPAFKPRLLKRTYKRLGRRYPDLLLLVGTQVSYLPVFAGMCLLKLYVDMSTTEFWVLVAVAEGIVAIESLLLFYFGRRELGPVRNWLNGERDDESTLATWRVLASLPSDSLRRWKFYPVFDVVLPTSIVITLVLDLGWIGFAATFAGGLVVLLYGQLLRFFGLEAMLRPVLEDVARHLPGDAELGRVGFPLRWKLGAGMPLINIVTGVLVAGLSDTSAANGVSDLAIDIGVAVLVSATVSLELTLLLTRSILTPVEELRSAAEQIGRGELDVRVPVTSTDEVGQLAQSFNRMATGLGERKRLFDAFGAYVDPDVGRRVIEEGVDLGGEEVEVTVMFIDIRGFTSFAERSSARDVVTTLNEYFGCVVPVVARHGGYANKFLGDGLLAVFGAPERRRDHADRAVAAALELAELVDERYGDGLRIGIGVNSGPVVAGTMGGGGRVEFTVIGDAVNTAARVEQATRTTGDTVLITQATEALLTRDVGGFVERPTMELRGKTEQVRLLAPRAVGTPATASEDGTPVALEDALRQA